MTVNESNIVNGNSVSFFMGHSLKIGDTAPDFCARSTKGMLTLGELKNSWVMLFCHPADFTPVCTSEFIALAKCYDRFIEKHCYLLGLSVDSLASHLAWEAAIQQQYGVHIPFPIIEDPSMAIAKAYGMLDGMANNTATVRGVYVIDPNGIVRAIMLYPLEVGRSVKELLRLLLSLQKADEENIITPEGWMPGEPVLKSPPSNSADLEFLGPQWLLSLTEEKHK